MRIVFVTRQYWPSVGGVERVVESLGQAFRSDGHEVSVVAQSVDETRFGRMTHIIRERQRFSEFTHNGIPVRQFRPSRLRRAALLPLATELIPFGGRISRRWVRRHTAGYYAAVTGAVLRPMLEQADVVHVLGSQELAVVSVEAAHALGKTVVISPFAHPGEWGDDSGSIRAYNSADGLLSTTEADADVYRALGVDGRRIHNVGLPVPDPAQGLGPHEPASGEAPLVVFLGQRRPTKRMDVLLDAIPEVWRQHPDTRFAFVGPGEPLALRDERVLDVGRVSDADRARWLQRADMLCLPSQSESFGLVVAEAWSQSVPVVVSDIPVLRELVTASGGGLAAEAQPARFAEAIATLLADPAAARAMGRAGRDYWQRLLTPTAVARRHIAIYERLIAERAKRELSEPSGPARPG